MGQLTCPECGRRMRLRNSRYGEFYGCSGYPKCRITHGAYPDGRPLGVPGKVKNQPPDLTAGEFNRSE